MTEFKVGDAVRINSSAISASDHVSRTLRLASERAVGIVRTIHKEESLGFWTFGVKFEDSDYLIHLPPDELEPDDPLRAFVTDIAALELDALSPIDALSKLYELQRQARAVVKS